MPESGDPVDEIAERAGIRPVTEGGVKDAGQVVVAEDADDPGLGHAVVEEDAEIHLLVAEPSVEFIVLVADQLEGLGDYIRRTAIEILDRYEEDPDEESPEFLRAVIQHAQAVVTACQKAKE